MEFFETLRLVRFDEVTGPAYFDYAADWQEAGEAMAPSSSRFLGGSFEAQLAQWKLAETEAAYRTGFVPHTIFFLTEGSGRLLGALSYRPRINDRLRLNGGHLGYGIRPTERRRGLGRFLLAQAAATLPCLDAPAFVVTCDEDNWASRRTIEGCGGVLTGRTLLEGVWTLGFSVPTGGPGPRLR